LDPRAISKKRMSSVSLLRPQPSQMLLATEIAARRS
jgi:hypothetical protein